MAPWPTRYEAAFLGHKALYLSEGSAYSNYFRAFAAAGLAEIHFANVNGGDEGFFAEIERLGSCARLAHFWKRNETARGCVDDKGAGRIVRAIQVMKGVKR
ncbi:hypothetical protein [Actibacterium sp. 188UL27-1]|uniref:hypothetical protein n=1 Tax=Actibacterium sp. 188UL27-1 TaxID=2786961 RepID=UPI001959F2DB|nr:hypothetical protein [Actibacterium sp. 188UL27-1]MBM7070424.1 hypothetical protein [Actibacterium sp. 188UL27-1]